MACIKILRMQTDYRDASYHSVGHILAMRFLVGSEVYFFCTAVACF
jgi:hypothetical protein